MYTSAMIMEIARVGAIKLIQSVCRVLRGVAVYDIKEDSESLAMALIHHFTQLVRGPVATGGSEKVCNLVPKGGIVDVFHDGHHLDTIVAEVNNARNHLLLEFKVGAHF